MKINNFWKKMICVILVFAISIMNILPPLQGTIYANGEPVEYNLDDKAPLLERVFSALIALVGLGTYSMVVFITGESITLESLFFDKFDLLNLNIFSDMSPPNRYIQSDENTLSLKDRINDVYSFFSKLAIIAYMIILLYVGIRILLNTGTENNAKYKEYCVYWLEGIVILFLFPYVIKYTIAVNSAFVGFIGKNNEAFIKNSSNNSAMTTVPDVRVSGSSLSDTSNMMDSIRQQLVGFVGTKNEDYMSAMFNKALELGWVTYAFVWLIMVKQLIGLLIFYFKRLLVVMFLIAIFPLVTITYALDKLGDGKSQAFGNWCKEFFLNVFIQSFHAIIYVIGAALLMQLGTTGNPNWILWVILVTFLSKGDEILKNIFHIEKGGGGDTVKSLAKTVATVKAIESGAKIGSKFVGKIAGKDSATRKVFSAGSQFMYNQIGAIGATYRQSTAQIQESMMDDEDIGFDSFSNSQSLSLQDYAGIALNVNSTEAERNAALDKILEVYGMEESEEKEEKLNELAAAFQNDTKALSQLEEMLKVRAAANAIMVGGVQDVTLNENIQIILDAMKGSGMAALYANSLYKDKNALLKLQMANSINFKNPDDSDVKLNELKSKAFGRRKRKGRKRPGDKYSGSFRTQDAHEAYQNSKRRRTFKQKGGAKAGYVDAKFARKVIRKGEKNAMDSLREINKLKKSMKKLQPGSAKYNDIQNKINRLEGEGGAVNVLRNQRKKFAEKGIYFRTIGKTQRTINRTAYANRIKGKVVQAGVVYKDITATFKENQEAKRKAKRAIELRKKKYEKLSESEKFELKGIEKFISERTTVRAKLFGNRPGGKVRMTAAQRMVNRAKNRNSVTLAREAVSYRRSAMKLRVSGDDKQAAFLEKQASMMEQKVMSNRRTSFRGYDPNADRKMTRAQRIIDRGTQKSARRAIKEARKKAIKSNNPALLSEAEKRIVENSLIVRRNLRAAGIAITGVNKAAKLYDRPMLIRRTEEEVKARIKLTTANVRTAFDIINERRTGSISHNKAKLEQERAQTSTFLKSRGVVLKEPKYIKMTKNAINAYDNIAKNVKNRKVVRDTKKGLKEEAKSARQEYYGNPLNGSRGIKHEISTAEKKLNDARDEMRKAGGDQIKARRAAAKMDEAMKELKNARSAEVALLGRIKDLRKQQIKDKNIKLKMPKSLAKLEGDIKVSLGKGYEKAAKEERLAEGKYKRINKKVQSVEEKENAIDAANKAIIENPNGNTQMRKLAAASEKKRKEARESAAIAENGFAAKLKKMNDTRDETRIILGIGKDQDQVVPGSIIDERSFMQGLLRQEKIGSAQGYISRTTEKISRGINNAGELGDGISSFARSIEKGAIGLGVAAYTATTSTDQRTTNVASSARDGLAQTFGSSKDAPVKLSLPDELMETARSKKSERITINGRHVSSDEQRIVSTYDTSGTTGVFIKNKKTSKNAGESSTNIITLNSDEDLVAAKEMVKDVIASTKGGSTPSGKSFSDRIVDKLETLACSIIALNNSSSGEYTASDIVGHIDNIHAIVEATKPGTAEFTEVQNLYSKLDFDLNAFESTVRIKVLNDPTLISDNDPYKQKIIDASIQHVKALPQDDVLISMLNHDTENLQEGMMPIQRKYQRHKSFEDASYDVLVPEVERVSIKDTMEEAIKRREIEERVIQAGQDAESYRNESKKNIRQIATNGVEAITDLTIKAPLIVGTALTGSVFGSAGSKDTPPLVNSAITGLTIADRLDQIYDKASAQLKSSTASIIDSEAEIRERLAKSVYGNGGNNTKKPGPKTQVKSEKQIFDSRKEELKKRTTVKGPSLTERLVKIEGSENEDDK